MGREGPLEGEQGEGAPGWGLGVTTSPPPPSLGGPYLWVLSLVFGVLTTCLALSPLPWKSSRVERRD